MNYSVLYIRLDSYARHRARKGSEIGEDDLDVKSRREKLTTGIFTTIIMIYPMVITILLAYFHEDFDGDVMRTW